MAANKVHWWDAPKGYKAILIQDKVEPCTGCVFYTEDVPIPLCFDCSCTNGARKDKQDVIFVKRDNKK